MTLKRIILIFSIVITMLILGWFAYYPQKVAIKESDLKEVKGEEYIICEPCLVTGFEGQIVESTTGYEGYVFIEGELSNVHAIIKNEITSNNKFVLYGKFVDQRDFYNEGMYPVFQSDRWDILAPIKRGTSLPKLLSPPYGLTWLDFYHK